MQRWANIRRVCRSAGILFSVRASNQGAATSCGVFAWVSSLKPDKVPQRGDHQTFGARLRDIRLKSGLSQRHVARAVGVSATALCFWESGRSRPRTSWLPKLARALHVTLDELAPGETGEDPGADLALSQVVLRARQEVAAALSVDVSEVRVFVGGKDE